jgi:ferrochelatase
MSGAAGSGAGSVGVLVMAHGTPSRRQDIEPFYTRIRRGRPPSSEQLTELEDRYAAIGGLSPLTERTLAQVDGVRAALEQRAPGRYVVTYGAKHTAPLIEEGAATLTGAGAGAGVRRVIGLVLAPHGASMGSAEYMERAETAIGGQVPFVAVPPWYAEPDLVALLAERVTDALASLVKGGDQTQDRYPVIFTAHSLPARVAEAGDTYPEQLEESARLVAEAAGLARWQVAWQSAGRTPEPWLGPDIRDVVRQLTEGGDVAGVVVCPIGFVTDHLEVLYDLDIELAAVAAEVDLPFARTASLNTDPRFIAVLADVVMAADGAGNTAELD